MWVSVATTADLLPSQPLKHTLHTIIMYWCGSLKIVAYHYRHNFSFSFIAFDASKGQAV